MLLSQCCGVGVTEDLEGYVCNLCGGRCDVMFWQSGLRRHKWF